MAGRVARSIYTFVAARVAASSVAQQPMTMTRPWNQTS